MRLLLTCAALATGLGLAAAPALAHHGLAKEFDMEKRITIKGKIAKVFWQNPHIYFTVEVPGAGGKVDTYNIESVPVAFARNAGLTSKKLQGGGQDVEVTMRPGLNDPHLGFGTYLKYADGFVVTFEGFKE